MGNYMWKLCHLINKAFFFTLHILLYRILTKLERYKRWKCVYFVKRVCNRPLKVYMIQIHYTITSSKRNERKCVYPKFDLFYAHTKSLFLVFAWRFFRLGSYYTYLLDKTISDIFIFNLSSFFFFFKVVY